MPRRIAAVVVTVALVAVSWVFLWPAQYGGNAAWLVVEGADLEPYHSDGDLIVARELGQYDEGMLVAVEGQNGPVLAVPEGSKEILGAPWLSIAGAGSATQTVAAIVLSWPFFSMVALASAVGLFFTYRSRHEDSSRPERPSTQQDHALAS